MSALQQQAEAFKQAVISGNNAVAEAKLGELKAALLECDSLPPLLCLETPTAAEDRRIAREIYEHAVILSINLGDKDSFQRHMSTVKAYYNSSNSMHNVGPDSETKSTILGLNLLFLLVENRLSDFHCELELLTEAQLLHPAIAFCTQLDQHLCVGSYDQVLSAASHPPVQQYHFFLKSFLETVRMNIAECSAAAYTSLSVSSATKILMFANDNETLKFVQDNYPDWSISGSTIHLRSAPKVAKSDGIPTLKIISQNLSYATELERIV